MAGKTAVALVIVKGVSWDPLRDRLTPCLFTYAEEATAL